MTSPAKAVEDDYVVNAGGLQSAVVGLQPIKLRTMCVGGGGEVNGNHPAVWYSG